MEPDDHRVLRTLRLRSLSDAPYAFGSTVEREEAFTTDEWVHRLRPEGFPHFVGETEDGTPSGMVALGRDAVDPDVAWLLGMWVDPAARGTGLADELIDIVIRTAAADGRASLRLHVADGNARAERVYARHSFTRTGRSIVRSRDDHVELEMERAL
jgi:ribosomal protein S18 acetylase RimI-like enzyme